MSIQNESSPVTPKKTQKQMEKDMKKVDKKRMKEEGKRREAVEMQRRAIDRALAAAQSTVLDTLKLAFNIERLAHEDTITKARKSITLLPEQVYIIPISYNIL